MEKLDPEIQSWVSEWFAFQTEDPSSDLDDWIETVPVTQRQIVRQAIHTQAAPNIPGFIIDERIGAGGLGVVWRAREEELDRPVALKVLSGRKGDATRDSLVAEARAAARVTHPNIITIHSIVDGEDTAAIVMELLSGQHIDVALASRRFQDRARVLATVARTISAAHARGLIHRDLKPANILVSEDLVPKILDFGLALLPGQQIGEGFAGTPQYASPEQVEGVSLGPATDVFSFGAVMYRVLCGQHAFQGGDYGQLFEAIRNARPEFPRNLDRKIPEELQAICLACFAKDPADRPTAADVAADIERYLAGEPIRLRPALYTDILQRRIADHDEELADWKLPCPRS